ncbi:MAG TPA: hypothetical protein PK446_03370 [Methanomassiliicoccaceae archaeon]|nr:hypothetical protein [Methanomassiliicoccaceae archaeon]
MPRRYPRTWMIWLLAAASLAILLLTPTLIGLAEVQGGLLMFIGIVGAVAALLLFLRAGDKCQACRLDDKRP